ncbi:RNA 2',3'-cyclic phosphodiesterase [Persicobacter psychrovividus]|uniref:2'-5' RNA ligase n=1 Tax=Persicobacter psychrovividus TaxID=387638 RepID=A0ABM7VGR4_9BACT|nr:2'-5' RNA ligase [Persicobacter psychrovividus]
MKHQIETERYFIAILPPEQIAAQAQALKEEAANQFATKGALNSPPHLTLHMPFMWKIKKNERLIDSISAFCREQNSFNIQLKQLSCFEPRVIFIDVAENKQLVQLQSALKKWLKINLNIFNADYKERPYHPHLTIAFRDLKKAVFPAAWAYFKQKEFQEDFKADALYLLKYQDKKWEVFKKFPLQEG